MARPSRTPPPSRAEPAAAPSLAPRLAFFAVLLLVVVVPFVFSRTTQESFRLPKLVAAEVLALVSVLLLAVAWARRNLPAPTRSTLAATTGVLAPLLVVASLGLFTSDHPAHLRQTLAALAIGVAACGAWTLGFERERLERLLAWSVLPGVGLALLGIGQFHDLYQPFPFQKSLEGSRLAVTSLAGNAGEFGAFLLLPALVAQWQILRDPARRPLWIVACAVLVYGQVASQTLTALAALVAGSALFWLMATTPRRRGVVALAATAGALVVLLASPPLRNRLATISDGLTVGRLNAALSGRLDGWRVATHLIAQHPVLGVGLGGYAPEFAAARLTLGEHGVEFYQGHKEAFFANAHNDFLEWGAESGGLGLLALGLALWTLLRRVLSLGDERHERAFALAAVVSLALLAMAYFPFRVPLLAYPILLFLAWALCAQSAQSAQNAATAEERT